MKKSSLNKLLLAFMLVLLLALAACGGGDDENSSSSNDSNNNSGNNDTEESNDEDEDGLYSIDDFSQYVSNEGEPIEGGSFTYGLVSDTAFEGTLNWNFYSGNPDAEIISWFDEALLTWNDSYVYTNDGAATYEQDGNTFTFTIRDNVNWHDGEPVTAEDWAFAHEVIGHPDYDGIRYGSDFTNIVGMEEYHNGEADSIEGIEVVNEKTLKITYKNVTPSLVTGSIWTYPLAKHIFEDIPVAEMSSSDEVRKNPIGFGPFKVDEIVPGESVTYVKNDDYWRGEPNLDEVTVRVISSTTVVNELETGGVDSVSSFPTDQYPDNADLSNVEFLGNVDRAFTYIGFKLGKWDAENGEVVPDPNAKMANKKLRQAMWHAVDNDTLGQKFYHGLRWNATTLIPPSHPEFHDETNPGRTYDVEKAKALLDEAGYVDVDGDGMREDPDGEELVINFASMSGGDTAEPIAQYYMQAWENVGLKVELTDGRLMEFNTFYDRVEADDPDIDIYQGAWGVGIDVDPRGLWGNAVSNYTRWTSEEQLELLEKGVSDEAFDLEYRQQVYNEFQELMVEEVPVFPTVYRSVLVPVNKRVVNFAIGDGTGVYLHELGVTEEEPIVAE
ncbi:oligopeptide ABC transporter substrate-binding protein [Ornithinibacillus halophilus]|uniref:Peptide/nickel transport system substrate-binding protein n=1 Tax=Ornithinibacillus halophilus TaxID=930117 RepID=A0A1M5IBS8_9BACI|nr:oligopeptide ABC transporter substrate-binding protein [Ornithinibacillus halophilus]SHG25824.1 peptide/nickel transport system substrate-binding protein [Ornithinibacillus halophilus]